MSLNPDNLSQDIEQHTKALRIPLYGFPDVIIHATETAVKKHPRYKEAKSGDSEAAFELVQATINEEQVEHLRILLNG